MSDDNTRGLSWINGSLPDVGTVFRVLVTFCHSHCLSVLSCGVVFFFLIWWWPFCFILSVHLHVSFTGFVLVGYFSIVLDWICVLLMFVVCFSSYFRAGKAVTNTHEVTTSNQSKEQAPNRVSYGRNGHFESSDAVLHAFVLISFQCFLSLSCRSLCHSVYVVTDSVIHWLWSKVAAVGWRPCQPWLYWSQYIIHLG